MEELKETTKVVDKWDYRDRNYYLLNNKQPLTYTLPSRHSRRV
jgi:hypothetical protein